MDDDAKRTGRTVGVLLLAKMAVSMTVNIVVLSPLFAAPGFLANAGANPVRVGLAATLGLLGGALLAGVAITAWPVIRAHGRAAALGLLALGLLAFGTNAIESIAVSNALLASQAVAKSAVADPGVVEALRIGVASLRNAAHYVNLIAEGSLFFALFATTFRYALVPRAIAGFGMLAALSQMTSVSMPLFGGSVVFAMLLPLGLALLAMVVWLCVRGFAAPRGPGIAG